MSCRSSLLPQKKSWLAHSISIGLNKLPTLTWLKSLLVLEEPAKLRSSFELFIATTERKQPIIIVLDEVQKLTNWESFVRTLHESSSH